MSNSVKVFFSYAHEDESLRNKLENHLSSLKRGGVIASWHDRQIMPGQKWDRMIHDELATAEIILLLISDDFLASDYCWDVEVKQAMTRHKTGTARVIPVILRPCPWTSAPFGQLQALPKDGLAITLWDNQDLACTNVAEGIRHAIEELKRPSESQAIVLDETCPYQGLRSFTKDTKEFFFGREAEVADLTHKLKQSNFVALIGPSGSGKSSVAQAGLLPRLETQGWQTLTMMPGYTPWNTLREALRSFIANQVFAARAQRLFSPAKFDQEGLKLLSKVLPEEAHLLLLIDQFEEVFTLSQPASEGSLLPDEHQRFVKELVEIGQSPESRLTVLITMRSDFIDTWLKAGQSPHVIQEQSKVLGALEGQNLEDAIVKPAERQGYQFEPGLLPLILQDIKDEPHCLPLLEFALTELWKRRDKAKRMLHIHEYDAMGKFRGALEKRAEEIYEQFSDSEKCWARRICLNLIRIDDRGERDTRQSQTWKTLTTTAQNDNECEQITNVITDLIEGRLLVARQSQSQEGNQIEDVITDTEAKASITGLDDLRTVTIDIAHEALIVSWKRLLNWRYENRDLLQRIQKVKDSHDEWLQKGKDDDYLLPGGFLKETYQYLDELELHLSSELLDFFTYSNDKKRETDALQRQVTALKKQLKFNLQQKVTDLKKQLKFKEIERTGNNDQQQMKQIYNDDDLRQIYTDRVKAYANDGQIDELERLDLENLRKLLGLSEEDARKIEITTLNLGPSEEEKLQENLSKYKNAFQLYLNKIADQDFQTNNDQQIENWRDILGRIQGDLGLSDEDVRKSQESVILEEKRKLTKILDEIAEMRAGREDQVSVEPLAAEQSIVETLLGELKTIEKQVQLRPRLLKWLEARQTELIKQIAGHIFEEEPNLFTFGGDIEAQKKLKKDVYWSLDDYFFLLQKSIKFGQLLPLEKFDIERVLQPNAYVSAFQYAVTLIEQELPPELAQGINFYLSGFIDYFANEMN